jgi:hypothetical protein
MRFPSEIAENTFAGVVVGAENGRESSQNAPESAK